MTFDAIESRVRALAETLVREGLEAVSLADGDIEIELSRSLVDPAKLLPSPSDDADAGPGPQYDVLTSDVVGPDSVSETAGRRRCRRRYRS